MKSFVVKCRVCGRPTSKTYARVHGGKCKSCETGEPRPESYDSRNARILEHGYDAYAREEGHY